MIFTLLSCLLGQMAGVSLMGYDYLHPDEKLLSSWSMKFWTGYIISLSFTGIVYLYANADNVFN